jgi:hypothetical protein
VPVRTELIEQIFQELWTTGRTIITEIDRAAGRIWELIRKDGQPARPKPKTTRRASRARKSKRR